MVVWIVAIAAVVFLVGTYRAVRRRRLEASGARRQADADMMDRAAELRDKAVGDTTQY